MQKNQCSLVYMLLRIHQETAIRINIRRTEITLYLTFLYKSSVQYAHNLYKRGYGITSVHDKPST